VRCASSSLRGRIVFRCSGEPNAGTSRDQRGSKPTVWSLHLFSLIFARGFHASQGATAQGEVGTDDFPHNPQIPKACRRLRRAIEPSGVDGVKTEKRTMFRFFGWFVLSWGPASRIIDGGGI
jgi:hypothetical protein